MLDHTDIQIARQGALTKAINYYKDFTVGGEPAQAEPAAVIALAIEFEDHLLDVDRINRFVNLFGALNDFPRPEPVPVAAAPTSPAPPPAPAPASPPPPAPAPAPPGPPPAPTGPPPSAPLVSGTYAGQTCPWHPDKTKTSKHHPDSMYCSDQGCEWQVRIFKNRDDTFTTKWLANGNDGWLEAGEFDAIVGGPA
jgi:hypothetical protein